MNMGVDESGVENRVFFDVFPSIAKGFIENAVKKGRKRDDELLKEVYENLLVHGLKKKRDRSKLGWKRNRN